MELNNPTETPVMPSKRLIVGKVKFGIIDLDDEDKAFMVKFFICEGPSALIHFTSRTEFGFSAQNEIMVGRKKVEGFTLRQETKDQLVEWLREHGFKVAYTPQPEDLILI